MDKANRWYEVISLMRLVDDLCVKFVHQSISIMVTEAAVTVHYADGKKKVEAAKIM